MTAFFRNNISFVVLKMYKRVSILFILVSLSVILKSCSLNRGFKAVEVYNYFEAKQIFEKKLKRHPVAANYGLSLIFERTDNPFHNLDSAYHAIMYSMTYFDSLKPRSKEKYAETGIDSRAIYDQQRLISQGLYRRALNLNTESAFSSFIEKYTTSELQQSAIFKRDSLGFDKAMTENSAKAYQNFLSKYPQSVFYDKAKTRYDRQLYNEQTADDKLKSYINFLKKYPNNPFVPEAEHKIYEIETSSKSVVSYELFIKRHPENRNIRRAWQELYDAYLTENLDDSAIENFIAKYPNNPFKNQIENDLELSKTTFFPVQKDGQWGFRSEEGKYLIDGSFDFVEPFSEGLAAVGRDGKIGYITKTGLRKIDFMFDDGLPFNEACAIVEINEKYGMINRQGEYIILPEYDYLGELKDGLIPFEKDGLYGYFDRKGRVKIKPIFDDAYDFNNGVAMVSIGGKKGGINTSGSYVFEPVYKSVYELDTGIFGLQLDEKWGMLTTLKDTILDFDYDHIMPPSEGIYLVTKNDSFNYVNLDKTFLLSDWYPTYPEYKILGQYKKNPILVLTNDGYNYIDIDGKPIFKTPKEALGSYGELIAFKKDGLWGYLSAKPAKEVIKPQYDKAKSFSNGFGMVAKGPLWGLIDPTGKLILEPYYEHIEFLTNDLLLVEGKRKFGLMNSRGDTLLPFRREKIEPFGKNIVKVSNKSYVAYYNYMEQKWIRKED